LKGTAAFAASLSKRLLRQNYQAVYPTRIRT
jgi:hypothetical protein